jgi:hypothetical protein
MKFTTRAFSFALGLAVIMVTGCGSEQSQEQVQPSQTSEETRPTLRCQERFNRLDSNSDGKVTFEEFGTIEHPRGTPEEIFSSRDLNGDGFLTEEEFCESRGMGQGTGRKGRQRDYL